MVPALLRKNETNRRPATQDQKLYDAFRLTSQPLA